MSRRLEGKIALISAPPAGRAERRRVVLSEGATVVGGDVLADDRTPYVDVTDEGSVADWIAGAFSEYGRIDILYNNAGAVRFGAIEQQSLEDWRFTLAAELDSIFLTCKHAWPHLRASAGTILNIGSTAGMTGSMTNQRVAHTASKGGKMRSPGSLRPRGHRTAFALTA